MKLAKTVKIISLTLCLLSSLVLNTALVRAAGSASFSLSPSSGSYVKGAKFTVSVYENSGTTEVNAVQANLDYSSAKLQFISIDSSGTAFSFVAEATGGSGHVKFGGGVSPPGSSVTGKKLVYKVTFKALASSGSSAVSFASSSAIVNANDNSDIWNHNATGGSYSFKSSTTSTPTTTKPTTNKTPTLTSNTNTNNNTSLSPSSTEQKSNPTKPVPASLSTIKATTYFVAIKVKNIKNQPLPDVAVLIDNDFSAITDSNGTASYTNIPAGTYSVTIKSSDGKTLGKSTITVDSTRPAQEVQQFEIKLKAMVNWNLILKIGVIVLAIIVFIGLWRGGMASHMRHLSNKHHGLDALKNNSTAATVIGGDGKVVPKATTDQENMLKPAVIAPTNPNPPKTPQQNVS